MKKYSIENWKLEIGNSQRSWAGFTLIELLIVIGVIASLAGIVLFTFPAGKKRARDSQRKSDIRQYQTALEAYANKNDDIYFNTSGNKNIINYCGTLGLGGATCVDDPQGTNSYQINSGNAEYTIWARLEMPNSSSQTIYFVSCSAGVSGERTSAPASSICPDPF